TYSTALASGQAPPPVEANEAASWEQRWERADSDGHLVWHCAWPRLCRVSGHPAEANLAPRGASDSIVFEVLRPLLPGEPLCLLDAAAPPDRDSEAANDSAVPDQLAAKVPAQAGPPMSSRRRQMLPCRICAKAFDRPSLLGRHMRTHTGEKPFACDTCGKAFSTSSSLNTHRRIHSGERPHECSACGKRFTASSNLYYHRMTHSREKPHRCAQCGKGFPTPGDLRSHAYVHSGRWPFKCAHCDRGFSKQTNLRNHELLHKGARRYECSDCPKKFSLLCNLKSHARTHAAEKSRTEAAAGPGGLPLGRSLVPHRVNFGCVDDLARPHRLMESLDADGGP
ncbi:hypothetical protein BOX15_Mlig004549g2, partial [Macrostomum lignano]